MLQEQQSQYSRMPGEARRARLLHSPAFGWLKQRASLSDEDLRCSAPNSQYPPRGLCSALPHDEHLRNDAAEHY